MLHNIQPDDISTNPAYSADLWTIFVRRVIDKVPDAKLLFLNKRDFDVLISMVRHSQEIGRWVSTGTRDAEKHTQATAICYNRCCVKLRECKLLHKDRGQYRVSRFCKELMVNIWPS